MNILTQLVNGLNWEVTCECCGEVYDASPEKSDASTAKSLNESQSTNHPKMEQSLFDLNKMGQELFEQISQPSLSQKNTPLKK